MLLAADFVISEILAQNATTLLDEDGDASDWIEIFNPGDRPGNLAGWNLTDDSGDLAKWEFPDVALPAGGSLVVFASGKNRTVSEAPLHTNFKLDSTGEFLALVRPDTTTIASQFTPSFPEQTSDISYGLEMQTQTITLVAEDAANATTEADRPDELGVVFTDIDISASLDVLLPGENILAIHGGTPEDFKLSNGGETIGLVDTAGGVIQSFTYDDAWYPETDGGGFSLVPIDTAADLDVRDNWRSSGLIGGSPGLADAMPRTADFNGDGRADRADVMVVLGNFGRLSGSDRLRGDLNDDGSTSLADLSGLQSSFGSPLPAAPSSALAVATDRVFSSLGSEAASPRRVIHARRVSRRYLPTLRPAAPRAGEIVRDTTSDSNGPSRQRLVAGRRVRLQTSSFTVNGYRKTKSRHIPSLTKNRVKPHALTASDSRFLAKVAEPWPIVLIQ